MLEIVLPCGPAEDVSSEGRNLLTAALEIKRKRLKIIWEDQRMNELIVHDKTFAKRFHRALLKNILGYSQELQKPIKGTNTILAEFYPEPGWEVILKDFHFIYAVANRDCPTKSLLHKYFVSRHSLTELFVLLKTPDKRERKIVTLIIRQIVGDTISSLLAKSGVELQKSKRVFRSIISIFSSGLLSLQNIKDESILRLARPLLEVITETMQISLGTECHLPFQRLFVEAIIPIVSSPTYLKFCIFLNVAIELQLEEAKLTNDHRYWNLLSAQLTRLILDYPHKWSSEGHITRLSFILDLLHKGFLEPSYHGRLLGEITFIIRQAKWHQVQIKFLTLITESSFTDIFEIESMTYSNNQQRLSTLAEFIKEIYRWYIEGAEDPTVQRLLEKVTFNHLTSADNGSLKDADSEYDVLSIQANGIMVTTGYDPIFSDSFSSMSLRDSFNQLSLKPKVEVDAD